MLKKIITIFGIAFAYGMASHLHAGGVILYEISSADTRMASAGWAARAEDPSTLFTNPAGMTRLNRQAELGAQAIFAHVEFDPDEKTTVEGEHGHANKWLPSGSFYYVQPYNECLTFGLGTLGYFGADLSYNHDWVGRYYVQKVLMQGISFVPSVAYKVDEHWSIGAGVNLMYGFFKQRSAIRNFLDFQSDGFFTMHDYRFGCGGVFGILYEFSPCTRVGVQYLSSVKLNFHDKPNFKNIGPFLTDLLEVLGILDANVRVHVKVPQGVMLSFYHDFNTCWSLMGNVGWQQWSQFQFVTVSLADPAATTLTSTVKYRDTWHVALGVQNYVQENLILSGGIAYDTSAISNKERPLTFPIGHQLRIGTGARWFPRETMAVDFCTELQWQGDLKVDVNKGIIAGHVDGDFKNSYVVFANVNVTWVF